MIKYEVLQFRGQLYTWLRGKITRPIILLKTKNLSEAIELRKKMTKLNGFNSKNEEYVYTIRER